MIVDAAESDRLTYSRYLQSDSENTYRIIESETLEEGLELWRSQQPDIVLIDLNLPEGDREKCLAAGANDYIAKPVRLRTLSNTIQELLRSLK